jgi:hypothetical protein
LRSDTSDFNFDILIFKKIIKIFIEIWTFDLDPTTTHIYMFRLIVSSEKNNCAFGWRAILKASTNWILISSNLSWFQTCNKCMFGWAVNLTKSQWHRDLVKASKCSFCQNCSTNPPWFCHFRRKSQHALRKLFSFFITCSLVLFW